MSHTCSLLRKKEQIVGRFCCVWNTLVVLVEVMLGGLYEITRQFWVNFALSLLGAVMGVIWGGGGIMEVEVSGIYGGWAEYLPRLDIM